MPIVSKKKLVDFWKMYPNSRTGLEQWFKLISRMKFSDYNQLRSVFPSADYVDGFIVFNIGGNKFRLITAIHFNRSKAYVRDIFSHASYDKKEWRRG